VQAAENTGNDVALRILGVSGSLTDMEDAMFSTRGKIMSAVFLLLSFSVGISWARQQSSMADADSAAIKQSVAAFTDAWNRHDPHAVAMRYVEDGDFSSTQGNASHGWKELEEHYVSIFGTFLKSAHRADTVKSIRFLTPTMASVDIDWQMTGAKTPDGADSPLRKGLLNWVMTKNNGQWLITIYHESLFTPPSPK
jgi:uncharacterized protein (TIGR02246 family)